MKFFISDIHLGDGSRADDFNCTAEFLKFLDYAEISCSRLIILGDLFELWQCSLDKIFFYHSGIIKKLLALAKKEKLAYIIGNHDHIPFIRYADSGIGIALEYKDKAIKLHAEHANQYDIFNRYKNPKSAVKNTLGSTVSYIGGLAERLLHPDIDEWALEILNKIPPNSKEYLKAGGDFSEYEKAARSLIKKGNRMVIFGHTHAAKIAKVKNGIYANCGAWCGKVKPTYVAVGKGKVELRNGITNAVMQAEEINS